MTDDMTFVEELPPRGHDGKRFDWDAIRAALAANPGAWLRVGPMNPSVATHIRNGRYASFPDFEKYDVETRKYRPGDLPHDEEWVDKYVSWLYIRQRV